MMDVQNPKATATAIVTGPAARRVKGACGHGDNFRAISATGSEDATVSPQ